MPYAKAKLSDYARKMPANKLFDLMSAMRGPDADNGLQFESALNKFGARHDA